MKFDLEKMEAFLQECKNVHEEPKEKNDTFKIFSLIWEQDKSVAFVDFHSFSLEDAYLAYLIHQTAVEYEEDEYNDLDNIIYNDQHPFNYVALTNNLFYRIDRMPTIRTKSKYKFI